MYMLIVTVVLQHNLGMYGLLFIHRIFCKLNFIVRLARRALKVINVALSRKSLETHVLEVRGSYPLRNLVQDFCSIYTPSQLSYNEYITAHFQWEDETARKRTGHPPSNAEASKMRFC